MFSILIKINTNFKFVNYFQYFYNIMLTVHFIGFEFNYIMPIQPQISIDSNKYLLHIIMALDVYNL